MLLLLTFIRQQQIFRKINFQFFFRQNSIEKILLEALAIHPNI